MSETNVPECLWVDRVSAMLDGEIPDAEREMIEAHAAGCPVCMSIADLTSARSVHTPNDRVGAILQAIPDRLSPSVRVALVVVGVVILGSSTPDFVRGNTMGNALHDLRHLAIWQASIGVAVLTAAVTFRVSRLVTVMLGTFLALTAAAAAYDVVTGHRGPWTDTTHVVEVAAVLLVLRLVWPQLRLPSRRARNELAATESLI